LVFNKHLPGFKNLEGVREDGKCVGKILTAFIPLFKIVFEEYFYSKRIAYF